MVKLKLCVFFTWTTVLLTISPYCQCKSPKSIELFTNHNQTFDRKLKGVFWLDGDEDPADHLIGSGRLEGDTENKPLHQHISGSEHAQAIAIQIENYSNKLLGDGQYHIYAGYAWPDKTPNSVGPGAKDVLIYSDKNSDLVACSGSVSWQIKENTNGDKGGSYSTGDKKGARIAFSWYISETYCSDKVFTDMQFGINSRININENGDWKTPNQKAIFNKHWEAMFKGKYRTTKEHHYETTHSRRIALKELKPKFEARVIVTNGCKPTVRIQVLGIDRDTKLVTEQEGVPDVMALLGGKEEDGTPLMSILVMAGIGVAGVVLAVVLLKTSIAIHKKRKHGKQQYSKVATRDEDEE